MPLDPYGFPSQEPTQAAATDHVAGGLTLAWALGSLAFAVVCAGCGGFIAVEAKEPTLADSIGVWLIVSACAWPALGITFWSVGLHLFARRWWAQAGPNLLLGVVTGGIAWFIVFCATIAIATE